MLISTALWAEDYRQLNNISKVARHGKMGNMCLVNPVLLFYSMRRSVLSQPLTLPELFAKLNGEVRMNIMITARHFDPTKPLKSSIEEKIMKLQKFSRDLVEAHMIIEREDKRSGAELILHSKTSDFYANAKSYDMYLAIDNVIRKMRTQLKTHQEKLKKHK